MAITAILLGWALLFSPWLGQAKPAATVAPSSGKGLCSALSPADFTKAGVPVSSLHEANLDGNTGAYCVYDSKGGRVEFDIFYPAGDTPDDVKATEKTVLGEIGAKSEPIPVPGADSAEISLAVPGNPPSANITVRKNKAVFSINIPADANARQQLLALAQTALSRLRF